MKLSVHEVADQYPTSQFLNDQCHFTSSDRDGHAQSQK